MDPITLTAVAAVATPTALVTAGVAWGAAKTALNGTRERVKSIEAELSEHKVDTIDRLARIETKLDMLVEEL